MNDPLKWLLIGVVCGVGVGFNLANLAISIWGNC